MAGPSQFRKQRLSEDDLFFDSRHPENQYPHDLADTQHPVAQAVDALVVDKAIPVYAGSTSAEMLQHRQAHYPAVAQASEFLHEAFKVNDAECKTQGRKWLTAALKRTGVGFTVAEQTVDSEMRRLAKSFPCGRTGGYGKAL